MKFEISIEDHHRIHDWRMKEVYPEIIAQQKERAGDTPSVIEKDCWDQGYPYGGAIGGDLTYSFTPTSLGLVTEVECYGKKLNLTNYEDW